MNGNDEARDTRLLLFVVGLVLGVPALGMSYWTRNDFNEQLEHSALFWTCVLVASGSFLLVLVSAISFAVALGKQDRPESRAKPH